jgi:hypothetical protein
MPRSLDLARLRQFEPASSLREPSVPTPTAERPPSEASAALPLERWPSREPLRDGQISIKAPSTLSSVSAGCVTTIGAPTRTC